ncbi:MAG: TlpA family protein disulfide reductase, partial [Candidatus Competibacter sp.]|nr:TlpA family protein disulfide reductase [Candidatus Competibacter sp.]
VITFPIALSGGNPVTGFDLKGLPTTFLISPAGKLVDTHLGTVDATMLAERIAEMEKTSNSTR